MARGRRGGAGISEEIRRRHAWLELLQTSGPFLALPVVHDAAPNGLTEVPKDTRARMRALIADMLANRGASRHTVITAMLHDALDWQNHLLLDDAVPASLATLVPGTRTGLRPDFAFHAEDADDTPDEDEEDDSADDGDDDEDGSAPKEPVDGLENETGGEWRLLGMVLPWGQHPLERVVYGGSVASGVERLGALLRARRVPVGIATDGRWWAVVWAPLGGTTGVGVWDASLFSTEPELFAAFVEFLGRARFFNAEPRHTLPRLLRASLARQEEVTETLGRQVRDAVEMLVAKFDQLDRDGGGSLLAGVDDDAFYSGVVTVMMRVVFLLFAEERRLLPSDDHLYVGGYSVGYLVDQLRQRRDYAGEQSLAHRTAAWHRLLALTRAIHAGVAHEDLRMPAYGGELFDPERYPWLEGRVAGQNLDEAKPPSVDDLTVLQILEAVQFVRIGGESRRLTFRALDVEQIGYVYEGLLELEVHTAEETMLGLARPPKWPAVKTAEVKSLSCEVNLPEALSKRAELGDVGFANWLADYSAWKPPKVLAALDREPGREQRLALERVVGAGTTDYRGAEALLGVVRFDARELPAVTPKGGRYVTRSTRRASSGTHYTPRRLAEEVVKHALAPLIYRPGPLETGDESTWELRPSDDLLELRIADIAMGSGAFLVATCRYLADAVVRAWELEGRHDALLAAQQRAGQRVAADSEVDAVQLEARRLVAEHCLYGVDINPLAVSMAKLSLWLITMDRERPFGFLDDRFVSGDSLLGLVSMEQLQNLHIDPVEGRRLNKGAFDFAAAWRPLLEKAAILRGRITAAPAVSIRDIEHKTRLLDEARETEQPVVTIADALTGVGLKAARLKGKKRDAEFVALSIRVGNAEADDVDELREFADGAVQDGRPEDAMARVPLHWPLAFPEIFIERDCPGFDAIMGNPPFLHGQRVSGTLGDNYLTWLQTWDGHAVKGSADLAARFVLRVERLLGRRGQLGLVTTNTVTETITMKVGLDQVARELTLHRARTGHRWPTASANLQVVEFWGSRAPLGPDAARFIDGEEVPSIGPDLEVLGTIPGHPKPLKENKDRAFIGSYVLGRGFTMTDGQRDELITRDLRNGQVIRPYVIGKDLNQRPDCSASRWVINFCDWPLERAELFPDLIDIVRREVKPQRDRNKRQQRRDRWWIYAERAPELYATISDKSHVLALSLHGSTLMPARVSSRAVFSHGCAVFAFENFASLALLSSSTHISWVIRYTSTIRTDIRYSPNAVFLTFPRPELTPELEALGQRLDATRRELMLGRQWGLTTTYNKVRDSSVNDPEIRELREIHEAVDHAVLAAYGWGDIDPRVGFHQTKIGVRWTIDKDARFKLLDHLRVLNQQRFEAQPS